VTFTPCACRIYTSSVRVTSGSGLVAPSPTDGVPLMRFLFVRPELCLQLPPHIASRRMQLLFG